jgi:hypothetical protein
MAARGTRAESHSWRLSFQILRPKGGRAIMCSKRSFAVVSLLFAVLLPSSIGKLNARDADIASRTFAAAQTVTNRSAV